MNENPTEPRVKLSLEQDAIPSQDVMNSLATWHRWKADAASEIAGILDEFCWSLGVRPPKAAYEKANARLCDVATDAALKRTARLLHESVWSLGKSPASAALCRILFGARGGSLEDEAELIGFSRQSINQSEQKLRRTFRLPRQ